MDENSRNHVIFNPQAQPEWHFAAHKNAMVCAFLFIFMALQECERADRSFY
ncbi:hypothetical protein ABIE05_002380 [Kosakonia cowanii]